MSALEVLAGVRGCIWVHVARKPVEDGGGVSAGI